MSGSKRDNLFAKLAQQTARTETAAPEDAAPAVESTPEAAPAPPPPSPAPVAAAPAEAAKSKSAASRKRAEPVTGKRTNPEYCQANAYIPKALRREVERALLDIDGLDYSSLVEELLRKWLKSKGVSA